jgi:hypothetical protein
MKRGEEYRGEKRRVEKGRVKRGGELDEERRGV